MRPLLLGLALALALVACGKSSGRGKRAGSAAPVEIVNQPQLPDAGGMKTGTMADEIEPNDSDDVATPMPFGTIERGKVEPETDVDHYRIEVDKPGALSLTLSGVDADLVLELADAGGTVIAKSDRGGVRIKEGMPNIGVTPGRYTAIVRLAPKKAAKPVRGRKAPPPEPEKPAPVYQLSAELVAPAGNSEREPDDDRGQANDLIVGDTASGYVGWNGDKDVWKLSLETLSAKNLIDIEVGSVEGVALELAVANHLGETLLENRAPKGSPVIVRNLLPAIPQGAPPFHYLTIKSSSSNPETQYTVKVTAKPAGVDEETEPNNSLDKPLEFPSERTKLHGTWTPGDVDYFALAPPTADTALEVTIDPKDIDLNADLYIDGKLATSSEQKGKGKIEKLAAQLVPGAKVVIRVRGLDSATTEGTYDVSVIETGAGDNVP